MNSTIDSDSIFEITLNSLYYGSYVMRNFDLLVQIITMTMLQS